MLNSNPININQQGAEKSGRCLDKLIDMVNSEITGACMIPLKLPKKEMINIVTRAKEWFYKNYETSVHMNYYVIPKHVFHTETFTKYRYIELPAERPDGSGRIFSVTNVAVAGEQMVGLSGKSGFIDGDFSLERLLVGGTYGVPYSTANGESLMYYVITENYYDMARQVLISRVGHEYNRLNRHLSIKGKTPVNHVVLETQETIDDCSLFSDEAFYRYIVATTKKQLGTMIMTFGYSLPGKITLNGEMIRSDAQDELDKLKEEIKGDEGVDYFYTS